MSASCPLPLACCPPKNVSTKQMSASCPLPPALPPGMLPFGMLPPGIPPPACGLRHAALRHAAPGILSPAFMMSFLYCLRPDTTKAAQGRGQPGLRPSASRGSSSRVSRKTIITLRADDRPSTDPQVHDAWSSGRLPTPPPHCPPTSTTPNALPLSNPVLRPPNRTAPQLPGAKRLPGDKRLPQMCSTTSSTIAAKTCSP